MTRFEKKVWLSSPTMHGEEIKYVNEAYETNCIIIDKDAICKQVRNCSDADIEGGCADVRADIFASRLCIPSDFKMLPTSRISSSKLSGTASND